MKDDRAETELLDALLSEPTIKFGNLMNGKSRQELLARV
jgi:hypothetical protein